MPAPSPDFTDPTDPSRHAYLVVARLIESREDPTGRHVDRIAAFSRLLATDLASKGELDPSEIDDLASAAALHDLGKAAVPDAILLKPGKLNPAEFETIQQHATDGAKAFAPDSADPFHRLVHAIIRSHHEKWDGTGYPDGLAGEDIPLPARIVAVADAYDALTSTRAYKAAASHERSVSIITRASGAHFDPAIIKSFRSLTSEIDATRRRLAR